MRSSFPPKHKPAWPRSTPSPGPRRAPAGLPGAWCPEPAELPPGSRPLLPSAAVLGPSGRVVPVLFFLRCFFLLACGDGGGSSFGLAALEMFGLELRESAVPLAGNKDKESDVQQDSDSRHFLEPAKHPADGSGASPGSNCTAPGDRAVPALSPIAQGSSDTRSSSGSFGRFRLDTLCTGIQSGR